MTQLRVAVLGGSGYVGGELIRLLLGHPKVHLASVIAGTSAGKPVSSVHPNLRGVTSLRFGRLDDLEPADLILSALPSGQLLELYPKLAGFAPRWIDLAPDHRLRANAARADIYGWDPLPEPWETGIPEFHRDRLASATRVAVPGCMAMPSMLAMRPPVEAGLVDGPVVLDALTGSSGSGAAPTPATHHAERAGTMRVYAPMGHRHTGEICQELGLPADVVRMSVTAVEPVRGILVKLHLTLRRPVTERDVRKLYAQAYATAPFVRLLGFGQGIHRYPDPRWLAGSNYCDLGFALDASGTRLFVLGAVDNLVKGSAGTAVQVLNIMQGWDEREALRFPGLHPV